MSNLRRNQKQHDTPSNRRRVCKRKVPYETLEAAENARLRVIEKETEPAGMTHGGTRAYRCEICDLYHWGHLKTPL